MPQIEARRSTKLLAGQSPEVTDGIPDAPAPGNLWPLTILNQRSEASKLLSLQFCCAKPIRCGRLKCPGLTKKARSPLQAMV